MGGCAAPNCTNHSRKNFRLFLFPRDSVRRQKWVLNCGRGTWRPGPGARLCEAHFEDSEFESRRADGWKKLKQTAIPTLFPVDSAPEQPAAKRQRRNGVPKTSSLLDPGPLSKVETPAEESDEDCRVVEQISVAKAENKPKQLEEDCCSSSVASYEHTFGKGNEGSMHHRTATKWGIVSAGKIAHDFVIALGSLPKAEHQVVAVASRNLERAEHFSIGHNIPRVYGSYEELAEDEDVEIVYVGVINRYHLPVGKLMLNARKHTLMEKPMGMNVKETKELIDLAKKKKVFLMESIWIRFLPMYKQLPKEIAKKSVGEIVHAYGTQGFDGKDVERIQRKDLGGGTILEVGVYMINVMCVVFKEKPEKIAAVGHLNKYGVDESVSVSLKYSKGRLASFVLSSVESLSNELVIKGTKGQIRISKPSWCPAPNVTPEKTNSFILPDRLLQLQSNFPNTSNLKYEAEAVRECPEKGLTECPLMTHKDSLLAAEITEEIYKQLGIKY